MRILFIANDDEGLYKFRKELILELLKENEVFISLPYGKYVDDLKEFGCKFIATEFNRKGTNPVKDLALIQFYRKTLRQYKIDVALTYTLKPNVYGGLACRLAKVPYISNITGASSTTEKDGLLKQIVFALYKIGLKDSLKVFFQNSDNMKFMLDNKLVKKNYELIPGSGVNLSEYEVLEYPNGDIVEFAYIARIMKEKGFEHYCEAAKYIKQKYPNTVFHVCGTYDEEDYKIIMNDLQNKGVLEYHGQVLNMKETIYKRISCTIHASYYAEGLSNALLETLASGRPIITTDKPGCKELVADGVDGFMIKQKSTESLINAIEKFMNLSREERREMGLNGRRLVEDKYSREIVINRYLNAINSIK